MVKELPIRCQTLADWLDERKFADLEDSSALGMAKRSGFTLAHLNEAFHGLLERDEVQAAAT